MSVLDSMRRLQDYGHAVKYCLCSFVLTDRITEDGSRGAAMIIGVYDTKGKAEKELLKVMEKTGMDNLYIKPTGMFFDITTSDKFSQKYIVHENKDGTLNRQLLLDEQKRIDQMEERQRIAKEIEEQALNSANPGTMDHYIKCWYLVCVNHTRLEAAIKDKEKYSKIKQECVDELRKAYRANPKLESQWLNVLETRLNRRGESDVLAQIASIHKTLNVLS